MTIPKNDTIETRLHGKDLLATYYAWGRLDQGHAPVLSLSANDPKPNTSSTAWQFGVLYRAMESAMAYEITCWAVGVQSAWENFVESEGKSVLPKRDRECAHEREPREWEGKAWCPNCGSEVEVTHA